MKITDKDWNRMTDLVLNGKDSTGIAKVIKNKDKAIARYVAGVKLLKEDYLEYTEKWNEFNGSFNEFGNKALKLGATLKEIKETFKDAKVPSKFSGKLINLAGKKLNNSFVGDISKKILDAGFDINYLPHNGYALTFEGKDAMNHNGRKWTIGYKTLITKKDGTKVKLNFDAITCEGGGPTSYVFENSFERLGKQRFIKEILNKLI